MIEPVINKERMVSVPRRFFQGEADYVIPNLINKELSSNKGRYARVDVGKCFCVLSTLVREESAFGDVTTSLVFLESKMYAGSSSRNLDAVRGCIEMLRVVGLIDYSFDVGSVSSTSMLRINIGQEYKTNGEYTIVRYEDYNILDIVGYRAFFIYCIIKNFYIRDAGYSSIGMRTIANIVKMSNSTVQKEINKLVECGAVNKVEPASRFYYDSDSTTYKKPCNRYKICRDNVKRMKKDNR